LIAEERGMPQENVAIRTAAAILSEMPILAVNLDKSLRFQFLDVTAGLRLPDPDFRAERRNAGIGSPVLAGVAAKTTVN
jgi:hypothetical protein